MTVWFTADLHLGHARIVELSHRPFSSIEEHDESLAKNWKSRVGPEDIIWVLGDIAIESKWRHALDIIGDLPGRKRLITGNHDQAWVGKPDWARFIGAYQEVFEVVTPWARTRVMGTKVVLSHFPYEGDHTEGSRFDEYRLRVGKPLIHGHTHSHGDPLSWAGGQFATFGQSAQPKVHQVHVGVDAWAYFPASDMDVARQLSVPAPIF